MSRKHCRPSLRRFQGPWQDACGGKQTSRRSKKRVVSRGSRSGKTQRQAKCFRRARCCGAAGCDLSEQLVLVSFQRLIVQVTRAERVLNMHFYMPPELPIVELMSCGKTDPAIIDFLMERLPFYGLAPFRVQRESVGFIFNRIWAAIKRESLSVVEEGVAELEDIDRMFNLFTAHQPAPFRLMDRVGRDVVLAIEEHYAAVRKEVPEGPRRLLQRYVDGGRLGVKSGRGFYDDYSKGK